MNERKTRSWHRLAACVCLLIVAGWGKDGHRIVGRVAEKNLTPEAESGVRLILGSGHLSDDAVANWADQIRNQRTETKSWHFVDIPFQASHYDPESDCENDDCVVARVDEFQAILADSHASHHDRLEALKFLVHFVGDLHQPLHCAQRNSDRGGNNCKVKLLGGKNSNLHSVWDSALIDEYLGNTEPMEYADQLAAKVTNAQRQAWTQGDAASWAWEAHQAAVNHAYAGVPDSKNTVNLNQAYVNQNQSVVEEQLERAGVRLGNLLNAAFTITPASAIPSRQLAASEDLTAVPQPVGKLEIHVLDVGQADAIFVRCPDGQHELLIDSGDVKYPDSSKNFKAAMQKLQQVAEPIEVVVATHPHSDHIGNMVWLLDHYRVGEYYDDGVNHETATTKNVKAARISNGAHYHNAQTEGSANISFCPNLTARTLAPHDFGHAKNPNNNSVIVRLDYGQTSFLFVGDCEKSEEDELLADSETKALLDSDFLKVGHHGSSTSSGKDFLNAVTPQVAAISCGARDVGTNVGYQHPRYQTIEALLKQPQIGPREGHSTTVEAFDGNEWEPILLNKAVYVTTEDGDLVFVSDGKEIHRRQ